MELVMKNEPKKNNVLIKATGWVLAANTLIVVTLVHLIQSHRLKLYPGGVIASAGIVIFNLLLLRGRFAIASTVSEEKLALFGMRGTMRLVWFFSFAIVIAIIVAVAQKDSRYLIQAGIGVVLVAYFVFILRSWGQKRRK